MSIALLSDIISKVRRLTGSGNSLQLTDDQIIDYINSFYLYDLPAQFRSLKLKDKYTFNTQRGIDVYPFDSEHYTTVEMPCYCAKREIKLFNDPWAFFGANFNWQYFQNFASGDGTDGTAIGGYSGTAQATPIIRSVNNNPAVGFIAGNITNVTQASPAVVTSVDHGLSTTLHVTITGVVGMTQLNGNSFFVTVIDEDTFSIGVDSTAYGAYVSGGIWTSKDSVLSPTGVFPSGVPPTFPQANISRVQNILITTNVALGDTLNVTDDGAGNLIGDCVAGIINYETGAISGLIFNTAVPQGEAIMIQYNPATLAIPLSIMFFQNQFTMRPVPDRGYTVELIAYRQPSQALLGTMPNATNMDGVPELKEWWELLAFGASKKVYEDRLDPDGVMLMDKGLAERYALAETRTYAQLGKQSISTMFRDQLNFSSTGQGFFGTSGQSS